MRLLGKIAVLLGVYVIVIPWLRGILLIYTPKEQDTMAARDFADIYTQRTRATGPRAAGVYVSKIPSSHGTSDIYHLGRTHLIGERTNENSSHFFYTVASEDRLWF